MEYDLNVVVKKALLSTLARQFNCGFDTFARKDWGWVMGNIIPFIQFELGDSTATNSEIERAVRVQWAEAKGIYITQELTAKGQLGNLR